MWRHTIVIPEPRLRVTLLSGDAVFEGPRPRSLKDLQKTVGVAMGLDYPTELVFCCGDTVLDRIEDAGEQVTAVRDGVMGLLGEFLRHAQAHDGRDLPEHLWPAREHRRLVLAAVRIDGLTLEYASEELRADRDVVLAAVTRSGWALKQHYWWKRMLLGALPKRLRARCQDMLSCSAPKISGSRLRWHRYRHAS